MTRLVADTINGLSVVNIFEKDIEIYSNENWFFDDLGNAFDGEIGCEVSDEMLNKIEEKFGEIEGLKKCEIKDNFYTEFSSGIELYIGELSNQVTRDSLIEDLAELEDQSGLVLDNPETYINAILSYFGNKE